MRDFLVVKHLESLCHSLFLFVLHGLLLLRDRDCIASVVNIKDIKNLLTCGSGTFFSAGNLSA